MIDTEDYQSMLFDKMYNLFQYDYMELLKIEYVFARKLNIPPAQLDELEFFRIEFLIEQYNDELKREHEAREAEKQEQERESRKQKQKSEMKYKQPKIPNKY